MSTLKPRRMFYTHEPYSTDVLPPAYRMYTFLKSCYEGRALHETDFRAIPEALVHEFVLDAFPENTTKLVLHVGNKPYTDSNPGESFERILRTLTLQCADAPPHPHFSPLKIANVGLFRNRRNPTLKNLFLEVAVPLCCTADAAKLDVFKQYVLTALHGTAHPCGICILRPADEKAAQQFRQRADNNDRFSDHIPENERDFGTAVRPMTAQWSTKYKATPRGPHVTPIRASAVFPVVQPAFMPSYRSGTATSFEGDFAVVAVPPPIQQAHRFSEEFPPPLYHAFPRGM